jgi:hypothetical protein
VRFDKETRAAIHEAAPHPATITWPKGAGEPKVGRLYWVQNAEDLEAEQKRRAESPETCAAVMASMKPTAVKSKDEEAEECGERSEAIALEADELLRERFNGDLRQVDHAEGIARTMLGERSKRRQNVRLPLAGSERIYVIATETLEQGFEAKVVLYEDPDPIRHLQIKTKVPAGPNPITGEQDPTETEPEQLPPERSRVEEEEALKIAHKASVDHSSVLKAEAHLNNQRRKGRRSKLAEEAVARAKKREAEVG